jgi:hypothetical protein
MRVLFPAQMHRRGPPPSSKWDCRVVRGGHDVTHATATARSSFGELPRLAFPALVGPLGYVRMRSLANPHWERDTDWLVRSFLVPGRATAADDERVLFDAAIAAARRYPKTATGAADSEQSWDEVLAAFDVLIERRQARHLAAVRALQER